VETRILGYGGSCQIAGVNVLVTSGSVSTEKSPSYMQPYSIPHRQVWRSKVMFATGTVSSNGSVSFDLTWSASNLLTVNRLLKRGYMFSVRLYDGVNGVTLSECYATSVSATGSVGGIVTASVSFVSANEWDEGGGSTRWMRDDELVGYWSSGNDNVRDWSFNFSQSVEPIFLNDSGPYAAYMKYGLCDANLEMTTYDRITHNSVNIAAGHANLKGIVTSESYNFNGASDVGTYHHVFTGVAELTAGSGAIVLS